MDAQEISVEQRNMNIYEYMNDWILCLPCESAKIFFLSNKVSMHSPWLSAQHTVGIQWMAAHDDADNIYLNLLHTHFK